MTWPHGVSYQGQWKCGKPHGCGVLMSKSDMSRYDGEWENGQRHGRGVETSSRGKYDGEWQHGMVRCFGVLCMSFNHSVCFCFVAAEAWKRD